MFQSFQERSRDGPKIVSSKDCSKLCHKLTFIVYVVSHKVLFSSLLFGLCFSDMGYCQILIFKKYIYIHTHRYIYIYIYIYIYLCVYVCVCIYKQCNTFERAHSHMLERFVWVLRTEVNSRDSVNYQESNFQSLEAIICYTLNVRSSPGGSGPWSGVVKFLLRYGLLFIRRQVMDAKANRIQVA